MSPRILLHFIVGFLALIPLGSDAATIVVRQDGSGDYLTITDAVANASANDAIDVGAGTYVEAVALNKSLTVFGSSGANATIVDGQGALRLFRITEGAHCVIEDLTLTRGYASSAGGAVRIEGGSRADVRGCKFVSNHSDFDGAAFFVRDSGSRGTFTNCEFADNFAAHNSGGGNAILGASLVLDTCVFRNNSTSTISGAVACNDGQMEIRGCLFVGNVSGDENGLGATAAVHFFQSTGTIENSTFHENASAASRATVLINYSPGTTVTRNIFSRDLMGSGLMYQGSAGNHGCNVFWDNSVGDLFGDVLAADEIVADPQFCNEVNGDFTLNIASPASSALSACGALIGAFPVNCSSSVPVQSVPWTDVKTLYR